MQAVIVIPARFNSTRFPGKPLAIIAGKSLIERVWLLASKVTEVTAVYIATDDYRIQEHAIHFGAKVILTQAHCENGTERVLKALQQAKLFPDIVINLQGDAVLTPPWVIQALLTAIKTDETMSLATPATPMTLADYRAVHQAVCTGIVGGTTVVFDKNQQALYFSKYPLPFLRRPDEQAAIIYRHIGLYAYRYPTLEHYLRLPPSPLEQAEQLEPLRALENNLPIRIVVVDYKGRSHASVDHPEDVSVVEAIIRREGELVA